MLMACLVLAVIADRHHVLLYLYLWATKRSKISKFFSFELFIWQFYLSIDLGLAIENVGEGLLCHNDELLTDNDYRVDTLNHAQIDMAMVIVQD